MYIVFRRNNTNSTQTFPKKMKERRYCSTYTVKTHLSLCQKQTNTLYKKLIDILQRHRSKILNKILEN